MQREAITDSNISVGTPHLPRRATKLSSHFTGTPVAPFPLRQPSLDTHLKGAQPRPGADEPASTTELTRRATLITGARSWT